MTLPRSESDQAAVDAFVAAVDGLSHREAADASGISHEAIRKYRAGEWQRLLPKTRRTMEAYVRDHGAPEGGEHGYAYGLRKGAQLLLTLSQRLYNLAAAAEKAGTDPEEFTAQVAALERRVMDGLRGEGE